MTRADSDSAEYKNQISEIIQGELIDLYGGNGYKSIMQTMKKICGKSEEEIITNFELFEELAEGVFGRFAESKILEPIKLEISKIGEENIHQTKISQKKHMRLLIADDEPEILELYKNYLESKGKEIITTTEGHRCVEIYKKYVQQENKNHFDLIILDQKMPIMTGLQTATKILEINPQQKIMFASGYLQKTLLDALTKLNRAIPVIEKPFSLDVLDHMINNITLFEKLDKININQEEKDISQKMSEAIEILENRI